MNDRKRTQRIKVLEMDDRFLMRINSVIRCFQESNSRNNNIFYLLLLNFFFFFFSVRWS